MVRCSSRRQLPRRRLDYNVFIGLGKNKLDPFYSCTCWTAWPFSGAGPVFTPDRTPHKPLTTVVHPARNESCLGIRARESAQMPAPHALPVTGKSKHPHGVRARTHLTTPPTTTPNTRQASLPLPVDCSCLPLTGRSHTPHTPTPPFPPPPSTVTHFSLFRR